MARKNTKRYVDFLKVLPIGMACGFGLANAATLDEIIITAEKSGERSLRDVPISVTAFDATSIERNAILTPSDFVIRTPGLTQNQGFGRLFNFFSIRGVNSAQTGSPSVVVHVDGFTPGLSQALVDTNLFELERIEVLKGPQSTLYGRNAIGGVINYVTKKPSDEYNAKIKLGIGNYQAYNAFASINGPLVEEKLAVQGAVSYNSRNGYFDNGFTGESKVDGEENVDARLAFRYAANSRFTADGTVTFSKTDLDVASSDYVPTDFSFFFPGNVRAGLVDVNAYSETFFKDFPDLGAERRFWIGTMNMEYEFDDFSVVSLTGVARVNSNLSNDLDNTAGMLNGLTLNPIDLASFIITPLGNNPGLAVTDSKATAVSQEIRFFSTNSNRFQWLLGGYAYFLDNASNATTTDIFPFLGLTIPATAQKQEDTNYAVFGNVSYDITNSFTVGAGLRFDYEKIRFVDPALGIPVTELDDGELLPRFFASYDIGDQYTVFASATRGYKSGGVNAVPPLPGVVPATFDSEFVWNFEAGFRGNIFADSTYFSLTGFYLDWKDQQIQQLDPVLGRFIFFDNAGAASSAGAELEVVSALTEWLTGNIGVSYLNAEYDEYIDTTGTGFAFNAGTPVMGSFINRDLSGNELPYAPKWSINGGVAIDHPLNDVWSVFANADVAWTSRRQIEAFNILEQNDYFLANASLGFTSEDFDFMFYAKNVFDEGYHVNGGLSAAFGPVLTTGNPRTFGFNASFKFNED